MISIPTGSTLKDGVTLNYLVQGTTFTIPHEYFWDVDGGYISLSDVKYDWGNSIYAGTNCTFTKNPATITPNIGSNSGTIQLVSGGVSIPWSANSGLQAPISQIAIQTLLGETHNDLISLNTSPNINQASPSKPSGSSPYSLLEWVNYFHTATSGVIAQNATRYIDTNGHYQSGYIPINKTYNFGVRVYLAHGSDSTHQCGAVKTIVYLNNVQKQTRTDINFNSVGEDDCMLNGIVNNGSIAGASIACRADVYYKNGGSYPGLPQQTTSWTQTIEGYDVYGEPAFQISSNNKSISISGNTTSNTPIAYQTEMYANVNGMNFSAGASTETVTAWAASIQVHCTGGNGSGAARANVPVIVYARRYGSGDAWTQVWSGNADANGAHFVT